MSEVTLTLNGSNYGGWKSAQVVSSLTQTASQFALSVTFKYPQGKTKVRPGDAVSVKLDGELICSGFVDSVPVNYSGNSVGITVNGRSKTADIVDCCIDTAIGQTDETTGANASWDSITTRADGTQIQKAPPASEWTGIDIKETISRLCARYGVKVFDRTNRKFVSKKVSVSKGTTVQDAICKLIEEFNLFITDSPSGDLVLSESKVLGTAHDILKATEDGRDTNVLSASAPRDYSDCYTDYEVFGQARPDDASEPDQYYNVSGKATSRDLTRSRVLRIFESGDTTVDQCEKKAQFEAKYRSAKAKRIAYTVQGWKQSNGALWAKGLTVQVSDEILDAYGLYLIESVTYDLSESGTTATLEVVPFDGGLNA